MDKKPGHLESKHMAPNNPQLFFAHQDNFLFKRRPAIVIGVGQAASACFTSGRYSFKKGQGKISWAESNVQAPPFDRLKTWLSSRWVGLPPSGVWSPLILSLVSAVFPFYHCTVWPTLLWGPFSFSLCPMLMHLPQPTLHLFDSQSKSNPDKTWGQ